ncbi:MAG: alanine--tRNA ligase, partial [Anaerolineales bacterium]
DFFVKNGHTFVPSSSLVPGEDQTLLFTNAGMVQFKDVFLGIDKRPYTRAANSQKCMRVAGKHNDLDDVGRDDTHHTFFEMLGNWSFGDYYKKEAIEWAWELFTDIWKLPKEQIWATCFEDEKGEIERDDEAVEHWLQQPGFVSDHILYFGRKENFWEMAETGPCGPNSEIHIDLGPQACNLQDVPDHVCQVNGNCTRFLELWNLVFIQYNRTGERSLELLPDKHVDTGMGLERIVSVLQGVRSNYQTDLFTPLMNTIQTLTGHDERQREENITPYRVIADHSRSAAFLIADGVIPGNTSRNYVCRMIIRRASRFGNMVGMDEPFLSYVAASVIDTYGDFYPELARNRSAILENITREEVRFHRTLDSGVTKLENQLQGLQERKRSILEGDRAFDLYATYGLPLEITRDIAREHGLDVDVSGFAAALEGHRIASGAGESFASLSEAETKIYRQLRNEMIEGGKLNPDGVIYNPYGQLEFEAPILAIIRSGERENTTEPGDQVEILLPETSFYVESGGQVSDKGKLIGLAEGDADGQERRWEIQVTDMRRPVGGMILHLGEVIHGFPKDGDLATAWVDERRRKDIMRNHTATHLLHSELRAILGDHVRQAGSLVAPERLRFDFNHPQAVTSEQLMAIEAGVNQKILGNYNLDIHFKPLQQAINEGAIALFGEKYTDTVRTISVGGEDFFSYELCGGTHVDETGDIGVFLIISEASVAAGVRRIEAVTGRVAYEIIQQRFHLLNDTATILETSPDRVPEKARELLEELNGMRKKIASLHQGAIVAEFTSILENPQSNPEVFKNVDGVAVLSLTIADVDAGTLRQMTDRFRQRYSSGVVVLAAINDDRPIIIAAVTEDLVIRGLNAVDLVRYIAEPLGGGGGGRPSMAQAGGRHSENLDEILGSVPSWVAEKLTMG